MGGLSCYRPKLIDFGLALFRGNKSIQTAEGVLLSTPEYTPPECIEGQRADARSDVYALGILLYECLTGSTPFVASNYNELLLKHLREAPPALPASAAALAPTIFRCLAKRPQERFQSALEVATAIREALAASARAPTFISGPKPIPLYPPTAPGPSGPDATGRYPELGSYELVELLGEGAMGQVFLAKHTKLGRQVAIKLLKPEHARNRDLLDRFFQEAKTVNQVNHEHIVEIHDFVEERRADGSPLVYCVMELLVGKTVAELLLQGPIQVARMVRIARQVAAGLAAAHRVGVVHRDVKPDNIFICERSGVTDYVKLLDFGVAKRPTEGRPTGTMVGTIIGTPDYMAPEQAAGVRVDARSDIWAVGVTLYEMLAHRRPFDAPAFGQLVVDINTKPPPPLPQRTKGGEEIPRSLRDVVMHCLEKDPARRPQTMEALDRELGSSLRTPSAPPIIPSAPALAQLAQEPKVGALPLPEQMAPLKGSLALGAQRRPGWGRWLMLTALLALLGGGGVYAREHPEVVPEPVLEFLAQRGRQLRAALQGPAAPEHDRAPAH
jgi:serine/threonine protein kinase